MNKGVPGAVTEMALIFLVAAALGIGWNHALLMSVWRGEPAPSTVTAAPKVAASPGAPAAPATSGTQPAPPASGTTAPKSTAPPKAPSSAAPSSAAPAEEQLPLPLGLMQVKQMYDAKEAVIVDARDAETFAAGHLAGALSLPLGRAVKGAPADFTAQVPHHKEIIVYCNGFSCHDSMELGKLLMKWGYRTVYVYEGGFPEWQDAGYPVEQGRK